MRVISGKYKGRKLDGFTINGTRPTMDRVKMSLFGIIQDYISNSIVLDLFAGSGALGIEALSEGAKHVYFVDNNQKAIDVIKKNISSLNDQNNTIINNDYQKYLENCKEKFNIIFLDPPYSTDYITKALSLVKERDLLITEGIIVCETDQIEKISTVDFTVVKQKKYGDKYIVILKKIV